MAAGLPKILISFKQMAETFATRSKRGVGFLIVKDTTVAGNTVEEISSFNREKIKVGYTEETLRMIDDVLNFKIYKLFVIKTDGKAGIAAALDSVKKTYNSGRITIVGTDADYTELITWTKAANAAGYSYHALCYKAIAPNSSHVESFCNAKVTYADSRGEKVGVSYLPSLLGILCSCNVDRSATYYVCNNLLSTEEPAGIDTEIDKGNIVLFNDYDNGERLVRIGSAVNTLTTFTESDPEDTRYIDIVDAQDLIKDDLTSTFKKDYVGQVKNTADNQMLFVGYVNEYFQLLANNANNILDPDAENRAEIDVMTQRAAWAVAKHEALEWDDAKVRRTPFKRNLYMSGNVKISGAMENIIFPITME